MGEVGLEGPHGLDPARSIVLVDLVDKLVSWLEQMPSETHVLPEESGELSLYSCWIDGMGQEIEIVSVEGC